jgi:hypothetical protein
MERKRRQVGIRRLRGPEKGRTYENVKYHTDLIRIQPLPGRRRKCFNNKSIDQQNIKLNGPSLTSTVTSATIEALRGLHNFYPVCIHRKSKKRPFGMWGYTHVCVLFIGWGRGCVQQGVELPIFPVYSNDLSNIRSYKTLHSKLVSYTQCTRADFQMRGWGLWGGGGGCEVGSEE